MKRKLCDADLSDDGWASPPPTKRLSMLHNTPKQWKDQRRKLLNISKQKLKSIVDVDTNLRRSVLLTNTYRNIKHQLKFSSSDPPPYTPRGVFQSSRRRLMMSQTDWQADHVAMDTQEDDIESKTLRPPPTDLSQVLSDIIGGDIESHDLKHDLNECLESDDLKECPVTMDTSVERGDQGGSEVTESEEQTNGNQANKSVLNGNQANESGLNGNEQSEDQTEALNLTVSRSRVDDCDTDRCDTTTDSSTDTPQGVLATSDSVHLSDSSSQTSPTNNTVADFVISPLVSEWKQIYQSGPDSLTFLPMFDLPVLTCPSLQSSNLIPKLIQPPSPPPPTQGEQSPHTDNQHTDNQHTDNLHTDNLHTDSLGFDPESTQQVWASFQQFNMAIACS